MEEVTKSFEDAAIEKGAIPYRVLINKVLITPFYIEKIYLSAFLPFPQKYI